jgi:Flp pilus assembly protein CpaB
MSGNFTEPSRRRRQLTLVVGVVLALIAGYLAFSLANTGQRPRASEGPKRTVVVAAHDLDARTVLTAEDVTTREVADDPSLAQTFSDPADVVDRVTSVSLLQNQVLYPTMLVSNAPGANFSVLGPDEKPTGDTPMWRAVSVNVPRDRAVGGQIVTGQHVDLFVTIKVVVTLVDDNGDLVDLEVGSTGESHLGNATSGERSDDSTKLVFQDLEVLQALPDQDTYILKVDLHQAEQITHVAEVAPGAFSLALRGDGDTRLADTSEFGETTDSLVLQFNFRVPNVLDLSKLTVPAPKPSPSPGTSPELSPTPTESPTP